MRFAAPLLLFSLISASAMGDDLKPGSPRWERSLRGRVVGPDNKPIAGAKVMCTSVRTPGEGLIMATAQPVTTDAEGRFAIYPLDAAQQPFNGPAPGGDFIAPPPPEHGDLVPVNSKYHIQVEVPADEAYFIHEADYPNTDPVTIRLLKPQKKRSFKYESPGGGFMSPQQLEALYLYYQPTPRDENRHLPPRYRDGGYLADGKYQAQVGRITFEPITIAADSPAELTFKLPPPITYRGKVVDGATGKPIAGAFVLGSESKGEHSLAHLESADWDKLEKLPVEPAANDPALAAVRESWGFSRIVRTDADGNYAFLQTPAMGQTYSLIFFARDRLPLQHRLYDTKPDANHVAAIADAPLFPPARVKMDVKFDPALIPGVSAPSTLPRWEFDADAKQPDWLKKFKKIDGGAWAFACDHWLPVRATAMVYVPADATLRLRLDVPYDDRVSPKEPDVLLKLAAGETREIPAITFERSIEVKVRVMSDTGVPVEGAPIRRLDAAQNSWSIVHNTDARGDAIFFIRPRSTGEFGIIDLPGMNGGVRPANLTLRYEIGERPPDGPPLLMKMTVEQVRTLRGMKPGGAVG